MDQIVDRNRPDNRQLGGLDSQPGLEPMPSAQEALGLDARGARGKRGRGWLYALAAAALAVAGLGYWQLGGSTPQVSYVTAAGRATATSPSRSRRPARCSR